MVEPYYKFYSGKFESAQGNGDFSGKITGANIGYIGQYFMAGIAIETGQFVSDDTLTDQASKKYDGGGLGTFIGFHFLDRFKVWTTYLNSTLEPTNNDDIRYFGQHVALGLGYRLFAGLVLNIEGFRNQYTQQEDDITGKTTGLASNIKTEGTAYFISYILTF